VKPLLDHVAIAIDGGGIKGTMVARALAVVEDKLGRSMADTVQLAAGTSTGSIISAGLAAGLSGETMHALYVNLGETVFRKTLRSRLWPLTRYRYPHEPLRENLTEHLGDRSMSDLWQEDRKIDLVITAFDLVENRTRFIKPWKDGYRDWPLVKSVLASCSVPTYFPAVDGRYVDGGVGSYANPCFLAAYEAARVLEWPLGETTLISLGTGRVQPHIKAGQANRFTALQWLSPVLGAFLQSADDQQMRLVKAFFSALDFRRFQVDLREPIAMDDPREIPVLTAYGEELGRKILNDETDRTPDILASMPSPDMEGLELEMGKDAG